MNEEINNGFGIFTIQKAYSSPYYPVRCDAYHHFTVHRTIKDAIDYLVGRFGADVVYEVKEEGR